MNIVITGGQGQLGKALYQKLSKTNHVTALGKQECDITNGRLVHSTLARLRPDVVIHTAAYTNVDQCEQERTIAFEINALGTFHVAKACEQVAANMFYISSDYVFDGTKTVPYREDDLPNPLSIYGMSKWLGERLMKIILPESVVIRTSWLYGHEGSNFVKTILDLASRKQELKVVADQVGSPTYVPDLVEIIHQLIGKKGGIYHVSNVGSCSWYSFATQIISSAGLNTVIKPVSTEEYQSVAPRPNYSVLDHQALIAENIVVPRRWEDAVKEWIRKEQAND